MSKDNAIDDLSQILVDYQKERLKFEALFVGLPYANASLIKSLISLAEPSTGIVSNISYHDLAKIMTTDPAPGRRNTGTPSKQTIRNYVKSIEREYGNHFKVITDGQALRFFFPEIPEIFNRILRKKLNTTPRTTTSLVNAEQNSVFHEEPNIEVNTEANTPNSPVKNIFINKNINNKQQQTAAECDVSSSKRPINPDFYPTQETIERAQALGFSTASDANEIQAFILFNQAIGAMWADYNPIYLRWLSEGKERDRQKQAKRTRSIDNARAERIGSPKTHKKSAIERVREAWASEGLEFCENTKRFATPESKSQQLYCYEQGFNWDALVAID